MDEAMLILSMFQYFIQGYIQLVIFLHYPSSLDGSSIDDTFPEKKSEDFEKVKGRHTILLPHIVHGHIVLVQMITFTSCLICAYLQCLTHKHMHIMYTHTRMLVCTGSPSSSISLSVLSTRTW